MLSFEVYPRNVPRTFHVIHNFSELSTFDPQGGVFRVKEVRSTGARRTVLGVNCSSDVG